MSQEFQERRKKDVTWHKLAVGLIRCRKCGIVRQSDEIS